MYNLKFSSSRIYKKEKEKGVINLNVVYLASISRVLSF